MISSEFFNRGNDCYFPRGSRCAITKIKGSPDSAEQVKVKIGSGGQHWSIPLGTALSPCVISRQKGPPYSKAWHNHHQWVTCWRSCRNQTTRALFSKKSVLCKLHQTGNKLTEVRSPRQLLLLACLIAMDEFYFRERCVKFHSNQNNSV